jgi:hypothetical protein
VIEKVVEVSNVGKLKEHKARGDQTFRRLTVIYGEHASGKTTLARATCYLLSPRTFARPRVPVIAFRVRTQPHCTWNQSRI